MVYVVVCHATNGYRFKEVRISNVRVSGVFLHNTGARDHRQFLGATKKTLHRQSLESVFVPGTLTFCNVRDVDQDPLQWPGGQTPKYRPRLTLTALVPQAEGGRLSTIKLPPQK